MHLWEKNMIEITGKYNNARVWTDVIEPSAYAQILNLLNQEWISGSNIAICPDVHSGKGSVVGLTMTLTDKVCANLVGVDGGCAISWGKMPSSDIDFEILDKVIRQYVPSGMNVHNRLPCEIEDQSRVLVGKLLCKDKLKNVDRLNLSIGTLGGGNHFIESAKCEQENLYLLIHSGSRNLGKQVAEYYQSIAVKQCAVDLKPIIEQLKREGRHSEIPEAIKGLKRIPNDLCYLSGAAMEDYLHDMRICQMWAKLNRRTMHNTIMHYMGFEDWTPPTESVHNYIDVDNMILRKGATSAQEGERFIVPINMKDGSLICIGRGNPEWNYSGPHGAGRIMSRGEAKRSLDLSDFQEEMKDIYTTSVSENTLDEAPGAYKPMEDIIKNIEPTAEVIDRLVPVYNFKAN